MNSKEQTQVYISPKAGSKLLEYLKQRGYCISFTKDLGKVGAAIALHPDVYMCNLGAEPIDPIYYGDTEKLSEKYPGDVLYNCAVVGKYIICSKYSSKELIAAAEKYIEKNGAQPEIVTVPQGYVKCNLAVIDSTHVITEDEGIYGKLKNIKDLNCLKISPKQVKLEGYPYGFIGGCCGRVENEILFNGDISLHPDFAEIKAFTAACGLGIKYFDGPLSDIGSIISSKK